MLFEVRVQVGEEGIRVRRRWGNGKTDRKPSQSYEGREEGTQGQASTLTCQEYDRLPRVTQEGNQVRVILCLIKGNRRGEVIGPRWRDLNDPQQPWKNIVEWEPRVAWQKSDA